MSTSRIQPPGYPTGGNPQPVVAALQALEHITQISGGFQRHHVEMLHGASVLECEPHVQRGASGPDRIVVTVQLRVEIRVPRSPHQEVQDGALLFEAQASYLIAYLLKPGTHLSDLDIAVFCAVNSPFNAMPFWREFVSNCLYRANLPPISLPLLKLGSAE